MGGMRQGYGVRQSVPYGLAAVVNNEMRANSMTSLSTDKSLANPDGKSLDREIDREVSMSSVCRIYAPLDDQCVYKFPLFNEAIITKSGREGSFRSYLSCMNTLTHTSLYHILLHSRPSNNNN